MSRAAGPLALLRACHPEPTAAVTAVTTALAVAVGRAAPGVVLVAAAVLAGQPSIGWLNDALDAGRDAAVGRRGKPVAAGAVPVRTVAVAGGAAAAACVLLSFASGWAAGAVHVVAVAAGWAYDLGVKATRWSVVPYLVGFGLLPAFVVLGLPGAPLPPWWLPAAAALMGAGGHVANVLPDLADDAATGVRGLPHRLGARASRAAAGLLPLAAAVLLALAAPLPAVLEWGTPVLAALVFAAGQRAGSHAHFRTVVVVAALALLMLFVASVQWAGAVVRGAVA
ncbi:UbiA family prenyltransferase [Pseudonocardia adelaidensis]|uniref:UbiA family prenyltransferase n=1 Tax=Pseudonocardia adelaidensis TaxID=648754 RepID=A0ABP9NFC7_9PSEU